MSTFLDPPNVPPELSWKTFNANNIDYIVSRPDEQAAMTRHYAGPNHHNQTIVEFDENTATDSTVIQVALKVPKAWCKAMTDGKHFTEGDQFYCKSKANMFSVPMAFNAKWTEFSQSATNPDQVEIEFNVSKLGHKFKLVWQKNKSSPPGSGSGFNGSSGRKARVVEEPIMHPYYELDIH